VNTRVAPGRARNAHRSMPSRKSNNPYGTTSPATASD
jgi:hypothetical protein